MNNNKDKNPAEIPAAVHDFLSRNGKLGGLTTQHLIAYAKQKLEEEGKTLEEFEQEIQKWDKQRKVS